MSSFGLSVGIVGLPNVGKSTLFNALRQAYTLGQQGKLASNLAYVANYPFATIEPNIGVVPVPDERLEKLADIVASSTEHALTAGESGPTPEVSVRPPIMPATVEFVDIAGLVAGAHKGEGLGNKFLAHIREVDAIVHVVRGFTDEDVVRAGSVSPKEDFEIVKTELDLADYETQDRASAKASSGKEKQELPLFSKKPILVVLNVDEKDLTQSDAMAQKCAEELGVDVDQVVVVSAKVESELAGLGEEDAKAYLAELGVQESGLERLIKKAFTALGLITFLTAGVKEVRAWTIKAGTTALEASGVIHTDFMDKFIKAEVVSFEDFVGAGGWRKSRELGKARLEGRDYLVKDGDVVEFKIGA